MAFFPESSASCLGQMTDHSCLYSSAHPGLHAYNTAATNQNILSRRENAIANTGSNDATFDCTIGVQPWFVPT